jgi:hypothetical protein
MTALGLSRQDCDNFTSAVETFNNSSGEGFCVGSIGSVGAAGVALMGFMGFDYT